MGIVVRAGNIQFELLPGAIVPTSALLLITGIRFGLWNGLTATALFFVSLLAHESAHLLAAIITGTTFSAVGFCVKGPYIRRHRARGVAEVAISAAGPAANLLLAIALCKLQGILGWVAQMNVVLVLVNLVPCSGSDGERIIRELRSIFVDRLLPSADPSSLS